FPLYTEDDKVLTTLLILTYYQMQKKIIIGLVGHPGSGKDTVAEYFVKKYGFTHISTSDLVREYIKKNNLGGLERKNMSKTGTLIREKHGSDYLVSIALKNESPRLIISGIRAIREGEEIKKNGGYIVTLRASLETRYNLLSKRGRTSEGTFEEFKALDEKEARSADPNAQNVEGVMELGDFTIENDSTIESLYNQIDTIFQIIAAKF
ncbi:MAG: nucleoside monophosphate kinase, partial [Candidatus Taylorbacteria bacterium]